MQKLPAGLFLRSGDAIHLVSARRSGFDAVWTNDRHMVEAASHFRLRAMMA
jgi:predicted nucleic acid-binding protein